MKVAHLTGPRESRAQVAREGGTGLSVSINSRSAVCWQPGRPRLSTTERLVLDAIWAVVEPLLPRTQPSQEADARAACPRRARREHLRAAHRHRTGAPAAGAGLRFRHDALAPARCAGAPQRLAASPARVAPSTR